MTHDSPAVSDPDGLERLRIVLVGAQHPGNIGAAARAMKVMGLADLALVAPERDPDAQAIARASGAEDVLAAARRFATLDAAVADCGLAIGTSARHRRTEWPLLDARGAAQRAVAHAANGPRVALVFGRERSGLENAELDRCQLHLQIPCNPVYRSLNLAAAVQVVCYELRMAAGAAGTEAMSGPLPAAVSESVTLAEMEGLYDHWQAVLTAAGFIDPTHPGKLMRRLRRLFNRAAPDRTELNILRGAVNALDPRRRGRSS